MSSRSWYLVLMLALLFLANLGMLMGLTNWPQRGREGFSSPLPALQMGKKCPPGSTTCENMDDYAPFNESPSLTQGVQASKKAVTKPNEGFMDYLVNGFATAPIGTYDGMDMTVGLGPDSQGFRARMPNVRHPPGTEMLPFVNNECKPECCGATMSCDGGGCVCTTPEDRDLINTRGGNRRSGDI